MLIISHPVLYAGKKQSGHSCGLHAARDGLGYDDLNQLQQNMVPLVFEFELLKVMIVLLLWSVNLRLPLTAVGCCLNFRSVTSVMPKKSCI